MARSNTATFFEQVDLPDQTTISTHSVPIGALSRTLTDSCLLCVCLALGHNVIAIVSPDHLRRHGWLLTQSPTSQHPPRLPYYPKWSVSSVLAHHHATQLPADHTALVARCFAQQESSEMGVSQTIFWYILFEVIEADPYESQARLVCSALLAPSIDKLSCR